MHDTAPIMKPDTGLGSYSHAHRVDLPGGEPKFYASAPPSREAFDSARDPLIAAQKRDLEKSEAQRRFELSRRSDDGSGMIRREQPKPVLKPSPALSMGPDRAVFNRAWSDDRCIPQRALNPTPHARRNAGVLHPMMKDIRHDRSQTTDP